MTSEPIRVVIVDDHPLVREGIRHALAAPGFAVVGEAGSGADGIAIAKDLRPDVIVLDINLPGQSGIETAAVLRHQLPDLRILMLSVHDHAEYVLESVKAGAHGYLRKDSLPEDLRRAIREVHAGNNHFQVVTTTAAAPVAPILAAASAQRLELLSPREREVLIGIASGKANKEIAADLGLGVRTVESYRESLIRKLGIPTAAGLTRFALETRLLARPGPP
jgi:two-component system, NarL family, nitrate/nitrite response regulator NarL